MGGVREPAADFLARLGGVFLARLSRDDFAAADFLRAGCLGTDLFCVEILARKTLRASVANQAGQSKFAGERRSSGEWRMSGHCTEVKLLDIELL